MIKPAQNSTDWQPLPYQQWKETMDTLHMWMQIVGKVKLELSPFLNQWWEVAFYLNARCITTGRIPYGNEVFDISFDFVSHNIFIRKNDGRGVIIPLRPMCVADFYGEFFDALKTLEIKTSIWPVPVEFSETIPFTEDKVHCSYDKVFASRWWRTQLQICLIFDRFRSKFRGKSSPIQFYWGSFDLNGTRFSGKSATPPKMTGVLGRIMQFAENEENFAFGFWPGNELFPHPAFFSYIYPPPKGIELISMGSEFAYYDEKLKEFILPYDKVIDSTNPEQEIMRFLETTYEESAKLADWNIAELKNSSPFDN